MTALTLLSFLGDLLLLLLSTMRFTRVIVADDIGLWFVRGPAFRWAKTRDPHALTWRAKAVSGLDCPFCIGFWIGAVGLLVLAAAGGPGHAVEWWRYVAGAFALNEVAAHLGSRLGDAGYSDDENE